jgi:hypothetical protein
MKNNPTPKKATAEITKPWPAAYWENNTCTFKPAQALAIKGAIPESHQHLWPSILDAITHIVRRVLAYVYHIQAKPPDKTVRQQLTLLENQSNKLLHTLHALHSPTRQFLDRFTLNHHIAISDFTTQTSRFLTAVAKPRPNGGGTNKPKADGPATQRCGG